MEFEFHTHPVTFCIIRNFYSEDEIGLVHEELERLEPHFGGAEKTGTARNVQGSPKKHNRGIFLDDHHGNSIILKLNRKLFSPEVKYELKKGNWFFKYLDRTNHDSTLVSKEKGGKADDTGLVTFHASIQANGRRSLHIETSTFAREHEKWVYVDGVVKG